MPSRGDRPVTRKASNRMAGKGRFRFGTQTVAMPELQYVSGFFLLSKISRLLYDAICRKQAFTFSVRPTSKSPGEREFDEGCEIRISIKRPRTALMKVGEPRLLEKAPERRQRKVRQPSK